MEYFSGPQQEQTGETQQPRTVERLSGWVTGMEIGARRPPESANELKDQDKAEIEFEKNKEAPKLTSAIKRGSMIAVGEVLADRSTNQPGLIGAAGVKAAKRQKLSQQETRASQRTSGATQIAHGLTPRQAVQLGALIGVCVAGLILVWLSVR
jgi:hypothetical protein